VRARAKPLRVKAWPSVKCDIVSPNLAASCRPDPGSGIVTKALNRRSRMLWNRASVKASELQGVSPCQANVTSL